MEKTRKAKEQQARQRESGDVEFFQRPPVVKRVGGRGQRMAERVSAKDTRGWVYAKTGQRDDRDVETALPDWDEYAQTLQEDKILGGQEEEEEEERSTLRSVHFGGEVTERGRARARIHRTGSVDIMLAKKSDSNSPDKSSTGSSRQRTIRLSPRRSSHHQNAQQAQGLAKFFEKQQEWADTFKSPIKKERAPPRQLPSSSDHSPSTTPSLHQNDRLVRQASPSENDKNVQTVQTKEFDESETKDKRDGEQRFLLEEEKRFWESRSQRGGFAWDDVMDKNVGERWDGKQWQEWRYWKDDDRKRSTESQLMRAVEWLNDEIKNVSFALFTQDAGIEAYKFSTEEFQELFQASANAKNRTELLELAKNLETRKSVYLRPLPSYFKELSPVYRLWYTLEEILYEFSQRDRHHKSVRRESILSVHNTIQSLNKQKLTEKNELEKKMAEKLQAALDRADLDCKKRILDLELKTRELQAALEDHKRRHADATAELSIVKASLQRATDQAALLQSKLDESNDLLKQEKDRSQRRQAVNHDRAKKEVSDLQVQLAEQEKTMRQEIERLQAELLTTRDQLSMKKNKEILLLREKHESYRRIVESKMNQLVTEHAEYVEQLESKHRNTLNGVRKELNMQLDMARKQTKEMEMKLLDLKEKHKMELNQLKVQHRTKEDSYQRHLERLRNQARVSARPTRLDVKTLVQEAALDTGSESPPPPPPLPPPPPPPPYNLLARDYRSVDTHSSVHSETTSPMVSVLLGRSPHPISRPSSAASVRSIASSTSRPSGSRSMNEKPTTFTDLLDRYMES